MGAPRRARAVVAVLLYALAVLGLPGLHLGFHRPDHDHVGGGIRYTGAPLGPDHDHDDPDHDDPDHDGPDHDHDGPDHDHDGPDHDHDGPDHDDPDHDHDDPDHDHDGPAHHHPGHAPHPGHPGPDHGAGSAVHWASAFLQPGDSAPVLAAQLLAPTPLQPPSPRPIHGREPLDPLGARGPPA